MNQGIYYGLSNCLFRIHPVFFTSCTLCQSCSDSCVSFYETYALFDETVFNDPTRAQQGCHRTTNRDTFARRIVLIRPRIGHCINAGMRQITVWIKPEKKEGSNVDGSCLLLVNEEFCVDKQSAPPFSIVLGWNALTSNALKIITQAPHI